MRKTCIQCQKMPRAVNYHRDGKIYYRKLCETCARANKKLRQPKTARWQLAGYKKKNVCEHCGFKPTVIDQLVVFEIDRNRQHIANKNLKTVCLNCNYELSITGWTQGDLEEDL